MLLAASAWDSGFVFARLDPELCGTHPEKTKEEVFLHRQAVRRRAALKADPAVRPRAAEPHDAGEIALIDDSNGVVGRRNPFDLNRKTLVFIPGQPNAAAYRFELGDGSYDETAASSGTRVDVGDDDTREFDLPFPFPFFGHVYQQIFINSDGNATFTAGDAGSTDRSFGRFTGGVPRIAPLFTDLDPSVSKQGVFVTSEAGHFVVSWRNVPLYSQFGTGVPETFQMRLYPDGRIEFTWSEVSNADAVVGIAPGRLAGNSAILSFAAGSSQQFNAAVGERFSQSDSVDIAAAAQRFYETHEDAYDYLVIFNSEGISAAPGAVAYEVTVRNRRSGFGDSILDVGEDFGSSRRLQAVLNMGPLNQYPVDPSAVVPARFLSRDTTMTVLGHEAGHLFLAYASVKDPNDPNAKPMLGRQLAHWSFLFNSEASFLEGNRIQDNGPDTSPRFKTIATVQGYAPLDEYLMGFRAAEEVSGMFLVTDSPNIASGSRSPQVGVSFDGNRRDITIQNLIDTVGRRTPDYTVAQRRFRFAFLLVVPAGTGPNTDLIAQLETYRSLFAGMYEQATSGRATAETSLKRALHISTFPATGLLNGSLAVTTLSLDAPAAAPLLVTLNSDSGQVALPPSVTIPAGATQAYFFMMGLRPGVDTITATARDANYETAFSKIAVADSLAGVRLQIVSTNPIAMRVTDINDLPYPNMLVKAEVNSGALDSATAISDADGVVRFSWTPGNETTALFSAGITGGPSVQITLNR